MEPSSCSDCGCMSFVEVDSFLTCRSCGLVAESRCILVPDYIPSSFADKEFDFKDFNKSRKIYDIIDKFEIPLNLTQEMMTNARQLLIDVKKKSVFKGEARTLAFTAAVIFYVSQRPISEIALKMGMPAQIICKAVTEIFELKTDNYYVKKKYEANNQTSASCAMLNQLVNKLFFISDAEAIKIKCAAYKIIDYFYSKDVIKPFKDDKLMATYIYMACEKLCIREGTLKNVALSCGATVPTIRNIYQILKLK